MPLLRRRAMMMAQQEEEYVIYVYNGYIGTSNTTYDEVPQLNSQYPNSVSTSSIPVQSGDRSVVTCSGANQKRTRGYNQNGNQNPLYSATTDNTYNFDGYIRFVFHTGATSVDSVKIIKADGIIINYKVIDRR